MAISKEEAYWSVHAVKEWLGDVVSCGVVSVDEGQDLIASLDRIERLCCVVAATRDFYECGEAGGGVG
jgi:hypothetical protein